MSVRGNDRGHRRGARRRRSRWTVDAAGRLERIPVFIRPMARQAIERFARERGYATVTDEVMDQARDFMGM